MCSGVAGGMGREVKSSDSEATGNHDAVANADCWLPDARWRRFGGLTVITATAAASTAAVDAVKVMSFI